MKICHVNLASGYSGGENQNLELIKQQKILGYEIVVVANPKSPFFEKVKALGCEVYGAPQFLLGHRRSITEHTHVMHVHEAKALYWALIQSVFTKVPYIVTRRVDNPVKKKRLLFFALTKAKFVVGISNAVSHEISKVLPNLNIQIIPDSPVNYDVSSEGVDQISGQFKGKFLVIQAARLLRHKGFDVSIAAAKQLAESNPNIHFCFLGEGPDAAEFKEEARGAKNISFVGKQHNMGDWFAAADALIHPAHSEGMGSVILEAMKARLPVIASKVGGIPDIIKHERNGLLIEDGNEKQLASSILKLENSVAVQTQMANEAFDSLGRFDIATTSKAYEKLYLASQ